MPRLQNHDRILNNFTVWSVRSKERRTYQLTDGCTDGLTENREKKLQLLKRRRRTDSHQRRWKKRSTEWTECSVSYFLSEFRIADVLFSLSAFEFRIADRTFFIICIWVPDCRQNFFFNYLHWRPVFHEHSD